MHFVQSCKIGLFLTYTLKQSQQAIRHKTQDAAARYFSLSSEAARAQLTYCWRRSSAELVDWLASQGNTPARHHGWDLLRSQLSALHDSHSVLLYRHFLEFIISCVHSSLLQSIKTKLIDSRPTELVDVAIIDLIFTFIHPSHSTYFFLLFMPIFENLTYLTIPSS